jgi:hypothetical protein
MDPWEKTVLREQPYYLGRDVADITYLLAYIPMISIVAIDFCRRSLLRRFFFGYIPVRVY